MGTVHQRSAQQGDTPAGAGRSLKKPIQYEPGWLGAFTRNQAGGALATGSRIVKVDQDTSDGTPLGTRGKVLGSLDVRGIEPPPNTRRSDYAYFIEWDDKPRCAVFCMDWKIAAVEGEA